MWEADRPDGCLRSLWDPQVGDVVDGRERARGYASKGVGLRPDQPLLASGYGAGSIGTSFANFRRSEGERASEQPLTPYRPCPRRWSILNNHLLGCSGHGHLHARTEDLSGSMEMGTTGRFWEVA